jgi:hypothetical protein
MVGRTSTMVVGRLRVSVLAPLSVIQQKGHGSATQKGAGDHLYPTLFVVFVTSSLPVSPLYGGIAPAGLIGTPPALVVVMVRARSHSRGEPNGCDGGAH